MTKNNRQDQDLVQVAKRLGNKKRGYLVVNPLQGKHIPVSGKRALSLFQTLGDRVLAGGLPSPVLFIGFCETATAIGAAVAAKNKGMYLQTTREAVEGVSFIDFLEEHSHAMTQRLVKEDLEDALEKARSVVFVEDEITTGNTIGNILQILNRDYPGKKYAMASLLNGMDQEALAACASRGVEIFYLVKTDHQTFEAQVEGLTEDGVVESYFPSQDLEDPLESHVFADCPGEVLEFFSPLRTRRRMQGETYEKETGRLWAFLDSRLDFSKYARVLMLGTEEFMYPAVAAAAYLEEAYPGILVKTHATTRSPITVSKNEAYPLHTRLELSSLYEEERKTYLYDPQGYDLVLVLSDTPLDSPPGLEQLRRAFLQRGSGEFLFVRWKYDAQQF